ncbi:MAG TPA: AarF/ABC1/UbiB kinase family protein [Candidatus Hydrogenedentes bacterium]|nr:AarF/ABC1/UbiB kinase family protein [Candidatus Hydrogenedentota bacterium]
MYYTKLGKRTINVMRFVEVLQVLVKHGFADLLRRAGFHDGLPAKVLRSLNLMDAPSGEPATFGKRLCAALTELGPTYVKFGQVLSTRPDLIGSDLAAELSQLQDNVAPLPFERMAEVLKEDLQESPDVLFSSFEQEPVASASLSQVYRATLPTGEPVAVKVQRPGVVKRIEADLSLMRDLAEWTADHMEDARLIDPVGLVDEFARSIRRELDFSIEARIIDQFRSHFETNDHVFIPGVHHGYSTDRVLTMDWVDGVRIDRIDEYERRHCDPHTIAVVACEALCEMVFHHRLFHADPHPGNIFILDNNRMAFLDLGMAGHLERTDVAAIADLLVAMFNGNSAECVAAILNLTAKGEPEDVTGLEHEVADLIAFEAHAIIGGGQVAKGIDRAIQILRHHNLELAPRFALLLKALGTVEVVGRSLDPKLDFVTIVQPFVEKMIYARFHPKQMLQEARHDAAALMKLGRQLPNDLSYLLQQLRRGRFKFQVQHEHLENLAATIDRSSNRNALAMIIAALIVGSSLLISTNSPLSRLGMAGYIFAGLMGLILVVSIIWTRKF